MRMRWLSNGAALAVATWIAVGAAGAATAKTLYQWKTADGTVAYADDLRRVPERYRSEVQKKTVGTLHGYKRFTPTDPKATAKRAAALAERVEHLRAQNTPPAAPKVEPLRAEPAPIERVREPEFALETPHFRIGNRAARPDGHAHYNVSRPLGFNVDEPGTPR
jgi:hypothetical protein